MNRKQDICICILMLVTAISIVYRLTNTTLVEVPIVTTTTETVHVPEYGIWGNTFVNATLDDNRHVYIGKNGSIIIGDQLGEPIPIRNYVIFRDCWVNPRVLDDHRLWPLEPISLFGNEFHSRNFTNKTISDIIAYDCIFTNCSLDNSAVYHCKFVDSNVTRTLVYASLFEYWYTVGYVDCSDGRASYNATTWWETK